MENTILDIIINIILCNNNTALILAARNGHSDIITVLIEAGTDIEAKDNVSKRISVCTCVCVCVCVVFLHHSVVLFYSSILLL